MAPTSPPSRVNIASLTPTSQPRPGHFDLDLTLRPPSPLTLSPVDAFDASVQRTEPKPHATAPQAFLRGTVAGALATAGGYGLPALAPFAALTPFGQTAALIGLSTVADSVAATIGYQSWPQPYKTAACAALFGGVAALVGCALATSPAFIGLSVAAKIGCWLATSAAVGGITALAVRQPMLTLSMAVGATTAMAAVLYGVTAATPLLLCGAAVLGASVGVSLHKKAHQFKADAVHNVLIGLTLAAGTGLVGLALI